jgi:hypothetical protein
MEEQERITERFFSNLWKYEEICEAMMTACENERQVSLWKLIQKILNG